MSNEEWAYGVLSERMRERMATVEPGVIPRPLSAVEQELLARLAALETQLAELQADLQKGTLKAPETKNPKSKPVWEGSEVCPIPTKR